MQERFEKAAEEGEYGDEEDVYGDEDYYDEESDGDAHKVERKEKTMEFLKKYQSLYEKHALSANSRHHSQKN